MPIRSRALSLAVVPLLGLWPAAALAAEPTPPPDRAAKELELKGVETNLKATEAEQRKIEADVEAIKLDRGRLNQALLDTTARLQKIEAERADATRRLEKAGADAISLEASFGARRERIAQLLAALQRMTHDAPPAIFVRPDDMAAAVRAAGVVNAMIGDVKAEADALSRDLARAAVLKHTIADERAQLAASAEEQAVDKARLEALVEARQQSLGNRQGALDDERKRADDLAQQATSLKDLLSKMDGEAAADKAAAAAVESRAAGPGGDLARLKPAVAFSQEKGRLPWPAPGTVVKAYGDADGLGAESKGVSLALAPGATVAAPADSWIAFAGPYRSYGQLLILNVGEGYYMVLAGMARIQVSVGQFVLAGEPVAVMGAGSGTGGAAIGAGEPVLYIELRKNDNVIDPQPWWAKSNLEKARG
ncbi:MAG TPA: peptidoglycan DD-metalloendopeptidase family protein [Roseiarcus sp.]|nr:peptidoglycan DD-metalloendopeptidase family protein [Roseiarcus sp.]